MSQTSLNLARDLASTENSNSKWTGLGLMLDTLRSLLLQYLHSLPPLCWRPKRRQLDLVSLPVEILAQAFTHLDFPGVLAVQLTCKTFYSVTKTRQFWYNRIDKLTKSHYIRPPEDELENYTVDELEQWALRRARALDVSFSSKQPRFRKRTVDLRPEGLSKLQPYNFKLIPGGRWLLIHHPSAVIYYMDLDSSEPTPRPLFDPKEIDDQSREPKPVSLTIWIDKRAPRLSFRLAFFVRTKARTYTSRIDIVGHGVDATLVASNIAMLRNFNSDLRPSGMTLNDRYLVHIWHDVSVTGRIGIYDYGLALGCPDYPMNHDEDHFHNVATAAMVELICDDLLAIQSLKSSSLSIFQVGPSSSLRLLHRIDMFCNPWSAPRWTPKFTVFTMMDRRSLGEVRGLVIPHDSRHPPTVVTLGNYHGESSNCVLGTRLMVAKHISEEVFRYGWDLSSPTSQPSALAYIFKEDFSTNFFTFDEDIGRFLGYPCRRHLEIYDII